MYVRGAQEALNYVRSGKTYNDVLEALQDHLGESEPTLRRGLQGVVLPGSVTLYAQASTIGDAQPLDEIRIGYQSQADPETITEAYYTASFGSWRTRVLGGTPELD
ncbi:hypothetical protein DFH29DRAFT_878890 [Suillus ampliporus]|nr:hypothetical protein DFH29DRAFT_878890 [Suillus ampliporus]